MEYIPIVDCSGIAGTIEKIKHDDLKNFSSELGNALGEIGFAYLTNHGVDMSKIEKVNNLGADFFALSPEVKRKYRKPPAGVSFHGYDGPAENELVNENKPKTSLLREFFDVTGHIESNDLTYFPEEVAGFKNAWDEARLECEKLTVNILRGISLYLGLPKDELVKRHQNLNDRNIKTQTIMRTLFYAPLDKAYNIPLNGTMRCGEHSDWHTITLLFQDLFGGLEVQLVSGVWVEVTPIKNAIILNIGQLLEIYSGGRLQATPHRVLILNEGKMTQKPRKSFVYAPSPDGSEIVQPLVPIPKELNGKVRSTYGPQSYDKVNAYEWIHEKHLTAISY